MEFDTFLQKFDTYFFAKKNITYLWCRIFSCNQLQGQNIDHFVTELKSRAAHCEFQTLKDSLVEDKLLIGVNDKKVQERLLREEDLEKAIQICKAKSVKHIVAESSSLESESEDKEEFFIG